jgi:hypothetical protein
MKKIKMLSGILAIIIAFLSSFTSQNKVTVADFEVLSEDSQYYYVADLTGLTEGVDYDCVVEQGKKCKVTTEITVVDNSTNPPRVRKIDVEIVVENAKLVRN